MDTLRQFLENHFSAGRAASSRPPRVNRNGVTPSTLSLVRYLPKQDSPSGVHDTFGKPPLYHLRNGHGFKGYQVVRLNQLFRDMMAEIETMICFSLVGTAQGFLGLLPISRPILLSAKTPVPISDLRFRLLSPSRIFNFAAIRQCSKRNQSYVDSHGVDHRTLFRRYAKVANNTDLPLRPEPLNDALLWNSTNGSVFPKSETAHFRDTDQPSYNPKSWCWNYHRIVAISRAETWKAWLLSCFATAKKCLKSAINPTQRLACKMKRELVNVLPEWTNFCQFRTLVKVRNTFAFKFPCIAALLQGSIIEFATDGQGRFQKASLYFSGLEPKAERAYNLVGHRLSRPACVQAREGLRSHGPSCLEYPKGNQKST